MRIAHITDLHMRHHLPGTSDVPERLSRAMPDLLAQALQHLRALAPDLLVVTGDLLDYPFEGMNDPATQELGRRDLRLIADLFAGVLAPLALVHGNHDQPALVAEVFSQVPLDQTVGGYRILTFPDDEGPGHVPQRTGDSLIRFHTALDDLASPPQIHVQHYIVWPEHNEWYPHTYGAGVNMRDAMVASGKVRLVLSGHYHPGEPLFCEKGAYFSTLPAFTSPPHPYALYDLAGDGGVTARLFRLA
jgi:predicted MPP superfamily phosphohydrolase